MPRDTSVSPLVLLAGQPGQRQADVGRDPGEDQQGARDAVRVPDDHQADGEGLVDGGFVVLVVLTGLRGEPEDRVLVVGGRVVGRQVRRWWRGQVAVPAVRGWGRRSRTRRRSPQVFRAVGQTLGHRVLRRWRTWEDARHLLG